MQTSPELLNKILGVLNQINSKMDKVSSKKSDAGEAGSVSLNIKSLLKETSKGKSSIKELAGDIAKLNEEIKKLNIKKLNDLVNTINVYEKIPKKSALSHRVSGVTQTFKDMSTALLYMGASFVAFAAGIAIAKNILGVSPAGVLGYIVLTAGALALSMIIISGADAVGESFGSKYFGTKDAMGTFKPDRGRNKGAIQSAKDMGVALMYIAGGVLAFSLSIALLPKIFNVGSILAGVGIITAIIGGMTLVIAGLGLLNKTGIITSGIAAASGIAASMAIMSLGVLAVAFSTKILSSLGDKDAKRMVGEHKGEPRSKFGQIWSAIGPGLGIFGLFMVSAIALFGIMGLPIVSAPVMLGAATTIMMSLALVSISKSIKKVNESIDEIGGREGLLKTGSNIKIMVGVIMDSLIEGITGSKVDKSGDGNLSLSELRQFRRVRKVIKTLSSVATSLSKFAQGLKAFSKLGEIMTLDYKEDPISGELKPILTGTKIHVVEVAKTVSDTFGLFIKTIIERTNGLTRRENNNIRKFTKTLTGRGGLISGINDFSQTLKLYAQFGKEKKMMVPEYDNEGNLVMPKKGKEKYVTLNEIVDNIVSSFGEFVNKLTAKQGMFEEAGTLGTKMKNLNIALMGKKGFAGIGERPGLLSAITSFSDTLTTYAQYGKDGKIPIRDPKTGEILTNKPPMSTTDVANQIIGGISSFISAFETAAGGNLERKAKDIKGKIGNFVDIVTEFDKLAKSQEGIEKLAGSMGLLATNVGVLVANMSALNLTNLEKLSTVSAQHTVATKGVAVQATTAVPATTSSTTASSAFAPNWDKFAEIVGQKIADKITSLNSGEFQFRFMDTNVGNLMIKR